MAFVIKSNHHIPTYLIASGDMARWSINPTHAAIYSIDKSKEIILRLGQDESDYLKIEDYDSELQLYSEFIKTGVVGKPIKLNPVGMFVEFDKNKHSKYDALDFDLRKEKCPYSIYRTWPQLYILFDHIWSVTCREEGLNDDYNRIAEVRVMQDSNFEKFEEEINLLLERAADGRKEFTIKIFDRFLSENGNSVELSFSEGKWSVITRWNSIVKDSSLKECFEYLKKERYYE